MFHQKISILCFSHTRTARAALARQFFRGRPPGATACQFFGLGESEG
eukprot:COSAG02_NODE_55650_length_289_cov_0.947368_1_plen_46_part_10